jgi:hypothetical protein
LIERVIHKGFDGFPAGGVHTQRIATGFGRPVPVSPDHKPDAKTPLRAIWDVADVHGTPSVVPFLKLDGIEQLMSIQNRHGNSPMRV